MGKSNGGGASGSGGRGGVGGGNDFVSSTVDKNAMTMMRSTGSEDQILAMNSIASDVYERTRSAIEFWASKALEKL